jgi:hypothetical protein
MEPFRLKFAYDRMVRPAARISNPECYFAVIIFCAYRSLLRVAGAPMNVLTK